MSNILNEFFDAPNMRKARPAKPKPRKPKFSVVPPAGEEH